MSACVDSLLFYLIYNRVGILVIELIHWKANNKLEKHDKTHISKIVKNITYQRRWIKVQTKSEVKSSIQPVK